jgi:hypothetical protein
MLYSLEIVGYVSGFARSARVVAAVSMVRKSRLILIFSSVITMLGNLIHTECLFFGEEFACECKVEHRFGPRNTMLRNVALNHEHDYLGSFKTRDLSIVDYIY